MFPPRCRSVSLDARASRKPDRSQALAAHTRLARHGFVDGAHLDAAALAAQRALGRRVPAAAPQQPRRPAFEPARVHGRARPGRGAAGRLAGAAAPLSKCLNSVALCLPLTCNFGWLARRLSKYLKSGLVEASRQPGILAKERPIMTTRKHPLIGRRVRLLDTSDPYTRLVPGATGTVRVVDALGTLHVQWDNGSTLGLVPGEDTFELLPERA